MAIRPIDLQTNISQVNEVGKDAQARTDAVVQQQHILEKESGEKTRLLNTKLEEAKKGESAVIRDQQKQKKEEKRGESPQQEQEAEGKKKSQKSRSKDDRMGNIIDILK